VTGGWLLDTNVLSELRRPKPHENVVEFVGNQALHALFVSEITFAEIRFGIEQQADAARRAALGGWLTNELRPMFERRTLPVSEDVIFRWRLLVERGRSIRHTFPEPDLLLGATAMHHGLTLVTRNVEDFAKVPEIELFNPWDDQLPEAAG
jgi:toxin FitB